MKGSLVKKELAVVVILLFVGISVIPSVIGDNPSFGNTIYVDDDGGADYTRIQDAIDNASDGDTVFVYSGTYYENLIVDKSISLIGENKDTTIIDGYENGDVVYITTDGVTISDFTIMNGKDGYLHAGVDIYASYTTISNNIIKNNFVGIAIWDNYDHYGVVLYGNVISDNTISSNSFEGIWLYHCKLSTVTNNIMLNNGFSGIHNLDSNDNLISGNILSNNECGLTVYNSSNNKISGNNIANNKYYGIFIYDSGKNNIFQNNFIESGKRNVKLLYYIWALKINKWDGNYWDEPRSSPYLIFGKISIRSIFGIIPWFEIDWHPAKEPYDIS